jgi:hypothetical protein
MPETYTNATVSSSAMSTNAECYQEQYVPAVMLTHKKYFQRKQTFEIILNSADTWNIVNGTEVAHAGNTPNAITVRTNFRKHSHTLKASETPRQYDILSKPILTRCIAKFGAAKL